MVEENTGPGGENPPEDDWAIRPRRVTERLHQLAQEKGFDVPKLMQGFVLSTIVDDDRNALMIRAETFTSQLGEGAQRDLLERLGWEVDFDFLPESIRPNLETLIEEFERADWRLYTSFANGKRRWEEMREFVLGEMDGNPEFKEDYLDFNRKYFDEELKEAFD